MHIQYFVIQLFMRWRKGHYSDQLIMTCISLQDLSAVYSYRIKVYKLKQHVVCRTTDRSIHSVKSASHRQEEQSKTKSSAY